MERSSAVLPPRNPFDALVARWKPGVFALAAIYATLQLIWYWQTPLGQAPVLDERENLSLAAQIAGGSLPREAFYRAMLYPAALALPLMAGIPAGVMPFVATAFGGLLHVAGALLVALWARLLFQSRAAGLIAGCLYALDPVFIHYSTQILDNTFATVLFLAGGVLLEKARRSIEPPTSHACGASLCWTLAALARPNFLLAWTVLPLAWWLLRRQDTRTEKMRAILGALLVAGVAWTSLGLIQRHLSGSFRLLPTQGAYNLWAANKPGADGRFFVQSIYTVRRETPVNPTRVETTELYTRETGLPADNLDVVNDYWRHRLLAAIIHDPAAWAGLMARKTYYLLNNAEPYNNKTYAFHKARSPWLRFNPLGWGVLLLTAATGALSLKSAKASIPAWSLIVGALAVSILLFFVSARFRLPLAALLCVLSGGLACQREAWGKLAPKGRLRHALLLVALGFITYSGFFNARATTTYAQDHLLIASAAADVGEDLVTWHEAGAALTLAPNRPDALAWRVTSYFNLLATLRPIADPGEEQAWRRNALAYLALPGALRSREVAAIAGLALWRGSDGAHATQLWHELAANPSSSAADALAALALAGTAEPEERARLNTLTTADAPRSVLLKCYLASRLHDDHNEADTLLRKATASLFAPAPAPADHGKKRIPRR